MAARPSTWAQDEVMEAVSLGFVPEDLQDDYQNPINGYRHMDGTYRAGTVMLFFKDYCQYYTAPDGSRYEIEDCSHGVNEKNVPRAWVRILNLTKYYSLH